MFVSGSFDYSRYLQMKGVQGTCRSFDATFAHIEHKGIRYYSFQFRQWFLQSLNRYVDRDVAAITAGFLIGGTNGLDQGLEESFRSTGTTHVVAVSGYNVSLIIVLMVSLLQKMGLRKKSMLYVVSVALIVFGSITGFEASISRALCMGWVMVVGMSLGRRVNVRNLLLMTAVVLVLCNPLSLRYDIGFQLSFVATAALMYGTHIFDTMSATFKEYISASIVAFIATLPITVHYFGTLSLSAPLVNILIGPFLPLAMLLGFFIVVFQGVPYVGWGVGILLEYIVGGVFTIVETGASFEMLLITNIQFPYFFFISSYLLFFIGLICLNFLKNKKRNSLGL
jgi:competence protein ComEC